MLFSFLKYSFIQDSNSDRLEAELVEWRKKISALNEALDEKTREGELSRERQATLEAALEEMKTEYELRIAQLEKLLLEKSEECESSKEKCLSLEEEADKSRAEAAVKVNEELKAVSAQLNELKTTNVSLQEQYKEIEGEYDSLQRQLEEKEVELNAERSRYQKLCASNRTLVEELRIFSEELESTKNEIIDMRQENGQLMADALKECQEYVEKMEKNRILLLGEKIMELREETKMAHWDVERMSQEVCELVFVIL